jgi:hypothetical protein
MHCESSVVDCLAAGGGFRIERFALKKGRAILVLVVAPLRFTVLEALHIFHHVSHYPTRRCAFFFAPSSFRNILHFRLREERASPTGDSYSVDLTPVPALAPDVVISLHTAQGPFTVPIAPTHPIRAPVEGRD